METEEVKESYKEMVRLEMEGKKKVEIAKLTGYDVRTVGMILNHDKGADAYRQELVKEKEKMLKRIRVNAEQRMKEHVEDFVEMLYKIAMGANEHGVRLNACVKGLQFAGMKLGGGEEEMVKAPKIVIRDATEKVENDGVTKPDEIDA